MPPFRLSVELCLRVKIKQFLRYKKEAVSKIGAASFL